MTNTRTLRAHLATAVVAAALTAAPGTGLAAAGSLSAMGTPTGGGLNHSSLRCHLELPVLVRGHRFVSSPDGASIACAGMLVGNPITAGAMPHASGVAKRLHWVPQLPPAIRRTQLSLEAVGAALPMDPQKHTPIKLILNPDPGSANGAGRLTGHAHIRRRDHQAEATIAFQPTADPKLPSTGRLIINLTVWQVSPDR